MDAKTLLKILHPDNSTAHWTISDKEIKNTILSALSIAAAVEGPEDACPWADSIIACIGEIDSETCDEIRQLERQRNAALRALKAERERAGKMYGLIGKCLGTIKAYSPAEGEIVIADEAEQIDALIDELSVAHVALAAQEGRHD